jgi:hypothetical protein
MERQEFFAPAREYQCEISAAELEHKRAMFTVYESQAETLREFSVEVERFRPMMAYDFAQPPIPAELNYEAWKWPMSGRDLCRAFVEIQEKTSAGTWKIAA